ncbi:MAG: enoyl-CoA hydratase/isomerase family protein [Gemmatimonadaceae bacterium]|nr:enoyl-CoA hydratase/isomerase family protein [Gemmatimonadaceae bacterium]
MTAPSPLEAGTVSHNVAHGIATVTFAHPKGNSLPGATLRELAATFDALAPRADVRVIVLRSEGHGPFCAGASFDELRSIADARQGEAFFSGFAHVILAMRRCPQFVIARIHGKAVGGGVGLAAAADYSIAVRSASVRLSELAVGIGPFVVGPVIEHKIGHGHYMAMSVDYDRRAAAWAGRTGLYARVAETPAELDALVSALAEKLAAANPGAVKEMKRVFWRGTEEWDTLLYQRAATSGSLILTEPARAALAAMAKG